MPDVSIRRRAWSVRYVGDVRAGACAYGHDIGDELDGACLHAERLILVDSELTGLVRLETELHELVHAREPDWHENRVRPFARDLARAMWRLGWRRA